MTVTNVVFTTVAETILISKPISSQGSTASSSQHSSQINTASGSSISIQSDSHSSSQISSHSSNPITVQTSSQAVSTTNALQVLSAAEQSFLAQSHASSVPQTSIQVVGASSNAASSSLLATASLPTSLPEVVTSSPHKAKPTGNKPKDGKHHTTGRHDTGTNTDSHETTSTNSSGKAVSINSHGVPIVNGGPTHSTTLAKTSSDLVDPVSVSAMSSSSKINSSSSLPPMLNPATATSSMDVTAVFGNGIPQGTFTATSSASSCCWKGVRLKILVAPIILAVFLYQ